MNPQQSHYSKRNQKCHRPFDCAAPGNKLLINEIQEAGTGSLHQLHVCQHAFNSWQQWWPKVYPNYIVWIKTYLASLKGGCYKTFHLILAHCEGVPDVLISDSSKIRDQEAGKKKESPRMLGFTRKSVSPTVAPSKSVPKLESVN